MLPSATTPHKELMSNVVEYVAKSNPAAVVTVAQPTSENPTFGVEVADELFSSKLSKGTA